MPKKFTFCIKKANFCVKRDKHSKITGRMATALGRISVALKHPSFIYRKFSGGQAKEDGNFASIEVSILMF